MIRLMKQSIGCLSKDIASSSFSSMPWNVWVMRFGGGAKKSNTLASGNAGDEKKSSPGRPQNLFFVLSI